MDLVEEDFMIIEGVLHCTHF